MQVLVTGARGFVGGRLVTALRTESHAVTVLVRDPTRFREDHTADEVSVVERDLLEAGRFDAVMHVDTAY